MFFLYIFSCNRRIQSNFGVKSISIGYVSPPNIGVLTPPAILSHVIVTLPDQTPFRNSTNKNFIYYAFCVPQIQWPVSAYDIS